MPDQARLARARQNLTALGRNTYPGRLVFVGRPSGRGRCLLMMTAIMGRSPKSRNRVYDVDHQTGRVWTEAADPSKAEDPHNIIYDAMGEKMGRISGSARFAASNGHQTNTILESPFFDAMDEWLCEYDKPIWTSRIAATVEISRTRLRTFFGFVRKSHTDESEQKTSVSCDRGYFVYDDIPNGYGYYMSTYESDGSPPPPFRGEPVLIPMPGSPHAVMALLWSCLNYENRIAIAGKVIDPFRVGSEMLEPINKYERVAT